MIKFLFIFFFLVFSNLELVCQVYVKGYYRKDGTYVQPHYRTNPNSSPYDNYSYPGNYNPHTGNTAGGNPDTYIRNLRETDNIKSSTNKHLSNTKSESYGPKANSSNPTIDEIKYSASRFEIGSREQALVRNGMSPQANKNSKLSFNESYRITADKLNLRTGPSTQFEIIAVLSKGTLVTIGEVYNETWVKVVFGEYEGFVHKDYLVKYD